MDGSAGRAIVRAGKTTVVRASSWSAPGGRRRSRAHDGPITMTRARSWIGSATLASAGLAVRAADKCFSILAAGAFHSFGRRSVLHLRSALRACTGSPSAKESSSLDSWLQTVGESERSVALVLGDEPASPAGRSPRHVVLNPASAVAQSSSSAAVSDLRRSPVIGLLHALGAGLAPSVVTPAESDTSASEFFRGRRPRSARRRELGVAPEVQPRTDLVVACTGNLSSVGTVTAAARMSATCRRRASGMRDGRLADAEPGLLAPGSIDPRSAAAVEPSTSETPAAPPRKRRCAVVSEVPRITVVRLPSQPSRASYAHALR